MAALRRVSQGVLQNGQIFLNATKQCNVYAGVIPKTHFSTFLKNVYTKHSSILRRKWKVLACVIGTGSLGTALLFDKQKYVVNADFPGQSIAPTKQVFSKDQKSYIVLLYKSIFNRGNSSWARKFRLGVRIRQALL